MLIGYDRSPSLTMTVALEVMRTSRRAVRGRTWPVVCDELMLHYEAVAARRPVPKVA